MHSVSIVKFTAVLTIALSQLTFSPSALSFSSDPNWCPLETSITSPFNGKPIPLVLVECTEQTGTYAPRGDVLDPDVYVCTASKEDCMMKNPDVKPLPDEEPSDEEPSDESLPTTGGGK